MQMDFEAEVLYLLRHIGIQIDAESETSPISFRKILNEFEIHYEMIDLSEQTDGMYVPAGGQHFIYINSNRPYRRRRFSIAHEFGHFYLKHPFGIGRDRNHRCEVEANRFASILLMPAGAVHEKHKWSCSVQEIATWFRVSDVAAAIRLKALGLRSDECECVISDYYDLMGDTVMPGW